MDLLCEQKLFAHCGRLLLAACVLVPPCPISPHFFFVPLFWVFFFCPFFLLSSFSFKCFLSLSRYFFRAAPQQTDRPPCEGRKKLLSTLLLKLEQHRHNTLAEQGNFIGDALSIVAASGFRHFGNRSSASRVESVVAPILRKITVKLATVTERASRVSSSIKTTTTTTAAAAAIERPPNYSCTLFTTTISDCMHIYD